MKAEEVRLRGGAMILLALLIASVVCFAVGDRDGGVEYGALFSLLWIAWLIARD